MPVIIDGTTGITTPSYALQANSVVSVGNSTVNTSIDFTSISIGNSSVNTVIYSTGITANGANISSVNATSVGGNTASDLRGYSDTSYSNATSFASNASNISSGTLNVDRISNSSITSGKLASNTANENIGYVPVNKAGDTLSGALYMTSLNVNAGSQRQIRTWEWSTTLATNTRYNLMYNNSAYTDVHFIFTLECFHASRSYAIYAGVFGGYGASFTNIGNSSTSIVPSLQDIDSGRRYFGVDVLSLPNGQNAECYFHMTIFGDSPITLVNGAFY